MKSTALAMVVIACLASPVQAQSLGIGPETGLSLPRFESLRFNKVNLRRGAGEDYPIAWTFQLRGLPVEVFQEFEDWRHVRDHDGATGWIHKTQLSRNRYGLIRDEIAALRSDADEAAEIVAQAEPGVVLTLINCRIDWCRAKAQGYRGWVRKAELWGVAGGEVFGEE